MICSFQIPSRLFGRVGRVLFPSGCPLFTVSATWRHLCAGSLAVTLGPPCPLFCWLFRVQCLLSYSNRRSGGINLRPALLQISEHQSCWDLCSLACAQAGLDTVPFRGPGGHCWHSEVPLIGLHRGFGTESPLGLMASCKGPTSVGALLDPAPQWRPSLHFLFSHHAVRIHNSHVCAAAHKGQLARWRDEVGRPGGGLQQPSWASEPPASPFRLRSFTPPALHPSLGPSSFHVTSRSTWSCGQSKQTSTTRSCTKCVCRTTAYSPSAPRLGA